MYELIIITPNIERTDESRDASLYTESEVHHLEFNSELVRDEAVQAAYDLAEKAGLLQPK